MLVLRFFQIVLRPRGDGREPGPLVGEAGEHDGTTYQSVAVKMATAAPLATPTQTLSSIGS